MQIRRRASARIIAGLVVSMVAASSMAILQPGSGAGAVLGGLGAGGEFHPLPPQRIYDTRDPLINTIVAPIGTSPAGGSVDVQILGKGGVPATASDVLAVVLNVTVTAPTHSGYLQAYPAGANAGISSIVNFAPGQNVPNLTVVTTGADGKLTIRLVTVDIGTADVVLDVFGWFSTSAYGANGARLIPVGPARIWDTREPSFNGTGQPIGQAQFVRVPIRGADSRQPDLVDIVPNTPDVVGVVLNITGINTEPNSVPTFVSVLPDDPVGEVRTSNLNLAQNQIKANLVIVPVSNPDGAIRLYNNGGSTHVAVDVVGYMLANVNDSNFPRKGRVIPLSAPFRTFDTREPSFGNAQLGPGQAEAWSFSQFVASVNLGGVPIGNQLALLGNLTGTGLSRLYPGQPVSTYFTVYPADVARPFSSNINVTEGVNVPNMAVVKLGSNGEIKAFNNSGYIHYLFDASAVVLGD